ncbi:hypothetical protein, partial [Collimonas sp.]|uniref:hypothetical protein n=1 Tax=Collimonas sp. TaxID=1963772 RepID=UPI0037BFC9BA
PDPAQAAAFLRCVSGNALADVAYGDCHGLRQLLGNGIVQGGLNKSCSDSNQFDGRACRQKLFVANRTAIFTRNFACRRFFARSKAVFFRRLSPCARDRQPCRLPQNQ